MGTAPRSSGNPKPHPRRRRPPLGGAGEARARADDRRTAEAVADIDATVALFAVMNEQIPRTPGATRDQSDAVLDALHESLAIVGRSADYARPREGGTLRDSVEFGALVVTARPRARRWRVVRSVALVVAAIASWWFGYLLDNDVLQLVFMAYAGVLLAMAAGWNVNPAPPTLPIPPGLFPAEVGRSFTFRDVAWEPVTAATRCPACETDAVHWFTTQPADCESEDMPHGKAIVWRQCRETSCRFVWGQLG